MKGRADWATSSPSFQTAAKPDCQKLFHNQTGPQLIAAEHGKEERSRNTQSSRDEPWAVQTSTQMGPSGSDHVQETAALLSYASLCCMWLIIIINYHNLIMRWWLLTFSRRAKFCWCLILWTIIRLTCCPSGELGLSFQSSALTNHSAGGAGSQINVGWSWADEKEAVK